jgi:hypothetical protein
MNLTKKLLYEMIKEEINNSKLLEERYERIISILSKQTLLEAQRVSKGAGIKSTPEYSKEANLALEKELAQFGKFLSQEEASLKRKLEFQTRPDDLEGLMEEAEKSASVMLKNLIMDFLSKARTMKIPDPEVSAALLINSVTQGAMDVVKQQSQMMKIISTADTGQREVDAAMAAGKMPWRDDEPNPPSTIPPAPPDEAYSESWGKAARWPGKSPK